MTAYISNMFSLEEKALAQVAINLCQLNNFKEVALNLEKPTYGSFLYEVPFPEPTFFVSDPETLSAWAKVKDDERLCEAFRESRSDCEGGQHLARWHAAVDQQCLRLTDGVPLPDSLKQRLCPWIKRISFEYLAYGRRQEVLFEVSRYFLMNILTVADWKLDGCIDEEKVARRLIEDERMTVLQKYLIACFYCLEMHIERLWNKLSQKAKRFFVRGGERKRIGDSHSSVFLWSRFMNGDMERQELWTEAAHEAIRCGNRSALAVCWKSLEEPMQQQMVIDCALESLHQWEKMESYGRVEEGLVSPLVPGGLRFIEDCALSAYYSDLTVFFMLRMDREQILRFFQAAFERHTDVSIIKFLLDWPYQDHFLPTVNQLWGIIPKDEYKQCIMVLAEKYSGNEGNADSDYDYRSLLSALWEATPREYKSYMFCRREEHLFMFTETETLLSQLLRRFPFLEADLMLFKQIFRDQPQEKRKEMMLTRDEGRELMCMRLIIGGNTLFLNWLLSECITEAEIARFKKRIVSSYSGSRLCMDLFLEGRKKLLEDVFDWCFESDAEIGKCKRKFISGEECLYACASLLCDREFAVVERVIDFCSSSIEEKGQFKLLFAVEACGVLLRNYTDDSWPEGDVWTQLDGITAWSADSEDKMKEFKKKLISHVGIETHYKLVFVQKMREEVERFYQWFALTPEEIKRLKWDTLFTTKALIDIEDELRSGDGLLLSPLRYCLADDEMVVNFKKDVKRYFTFLWKEEQLDKLLSKLLEGIQTEVQNETNVGGSFVKDKEGKRSVVVEDESDSPKKRPK